MGSGCGLEAHLEIRGFLLEGHAGSRVPCAGWDSGSEGSFWIHSTGFKSQSYHLPAESSRIICINFKHFPNYKVAVITAPYPTSSYEDESTWVG